MKQPISNRKRAAIIIAWWCFAFGVWPLADPGHSGTSLLTIIDIALHFAGGYYLATQMWRLTIKPMMRRVKFVYVVVERPDQ